MGGGEIKFIQEAFESNWIAPLGPNVNGFENELEAYLGEKVHVAALSSGTAALHLSLILAGVSSGDTVLCQSFTFSATVNPIIYQNAEPIFIDSELDTWNMDPILLRKAIIDEISIGKKPKACIVVHLYGMPAKIEEIKAICDEFKITLIEDAAEALGSSYKGQKLGTFGEYGVLSFNGNKIITTSGGGALICKTFEKAEEARFLATQAREDFPHYEHKRIGYNYRMSNIAAGIGRGQLEVLDEWVNKRRLNFETYKTQLETFNLSFLKEPECFYSNRWLSCMVFDAYELKEKIRTRLWEQNIETRPLWKPMHLQPVFEKFRSYTNGTCSLLFERGLCVPSGSNLMAEDLENVIMAIRRNILAI